MSADPITSLFFRGRHSSVCINLANVEFAVSGPSSYDTVTVHMRSGNKLILTASDASMFKSHWLALSTQPRGNQHDTVS